jgi:hypothetical protein
VKDWVVDVCVLDTVEKVEEPALACVTFLHLQTVNNEGICLDNDGVILSTYESHVDLHNPSDFVGKWWKAVQHGNLVRFIFSHVPKTMEENLLKLKFHDDDIIFVRVAFASLSKRIVSLDSDFGCNPASSRNRDDIKELLGTYRITTLTPAEAVTSLRVI